MNEPAADLEINTNYLAGHFEEFLSDEIAEYCVTMTCSGPLIKSDFVSSPAFTFEYDSIFDRYEDFHRKVDSMARDYADSIDSRVIGFVKQQTCILDRTPYQTASSEELSDFISRLGIHLTILGLPQNNRWIFINQSLVNVLHDGTEKCRPNCHHPFYVGRIHNFDLWFSPHVNDFAIAFGQGEPIGFEWYVKETRGTEEANSYRWVYQADVEVSNKPTLLHNNAVHYVRLIEPEPPRMTWVN